MSESVGSQNYQNHPEDAGGPGSGRDESSYVRDCEFIHLKVRTQFSILQGAIHHESLMEQVKKLGFSAVAATDTNNLFGAIEFYQEAKKAGIKPIFGCTLSFLREGYQQWMGGLTGTSSSNAIQESQRVKLRPKFFELTVLCENNQGYYNLCQILTEAYKSAPPARKGVPAPPKCLTSWELLKKYSEGLIVLLGGLKSEVGYHLWAKEETEALESLRSFYAVFGDRLYLDLVDSQIPEIQHINQQLDQYGKQLKIPTVATVDVHYLSPDDAEAQEILQCIENGRNLDLDRPKSLVPTDFYLKSKEEVLENMRSFEGACQRTVEIANRCKVELKFTDAQGKPIYHLPNFRPDGIAKEDSSFHLEEYFKKVVREGLIERFHSKPFREKTELPNWEELKKTYHERLESEIAMIERTGFCGYFLIVSDFIKYAKSNAIPVGPGRGSGAGSLVAYSLFITDIDPIEFNLLFERFINPERISMPDFDVDFCQNRRGEVIDYVKRKYGTENVSQIITFGKLQARAVLKDVGRVLGLSFAETDEINKLLPEELGITLDGALEKEPKVRAKLEADPKAATVFSIARKLEGLTRNPGIHAAGVIITENPVSEYCPLYVSKDGDVVTQFDKDSAEKVGLIKFDFLGLKTLTVIDQAIQLIRAEEDFILEEISYKDPRVFALISSGDTDGVFQVESSGMKDLCSRIQPNSLEDLTAINALYRPGPLGSGMVTDFIDRKHGRKSIEYDLPALEPILKETYGVILYQEQVMRIARELAGYSLGQADLLRRAMGKKKPEEMDKQRSIFTKGAVDKGIPLEKAQGIFDLMAKFAEYGFNKSHSAAYGVLTYQTAYLKTHYPAQFMAALMTTEINDTDKITRYLQDAKAHGIAILPPSVNYSQRQFSVEILEGGAKAIRFGLEAIKGVGGIAVDEILQARKNTHGLFKDLVDFAKRVSPRKVNKKVYEALTLSGSFGGIAGEYNRPTILASLEKLLTFAQEEHAEKERGQSSLFDSFQSDSLPSVISLGSIFKVEPDFTRARKLTTEKETVGFFVSGHPMDAWQNLTKDWVGWDLEKVKTSPPQNPKPSGDSWRQGKPPPRAQIQLGGLITESKEIVTKKGQRMAFLKIEDLTGSIEGVVFPEPYEAFGPVAAAAMAQAEPVLIQAEVDSQNPEQVKLLVKGIKLLEEAYAGRARRVVITLSLEQTKPEQLVDLNKVLLQHRGTYPVRVDLVATKFKTGFDLAEGRGVDGSTKLIESIQKLFAGPVVKLH